MKKILSIIFSVLFLNISVMTVMADGSGLKVGEKAPNFEGITSEGEPFQLQDFYQESPVVLIFYRGGWCPYCHYQLQMFEKKMDQFVDQGVDIVAVSVDTLAEVQKMKDGESYGLELAAKNPEKFDVEQIGYSFDIVGGISVETLKAYNAVQHVDDETHQKYLEWGIDLEVSSGKTHHMIAVPATYVIGSDGSILFADSDRDYKKRTSPETVLEFLESWEG